MVREPLALRLMSIVDVWTELIFPLLLKFAVCP